MCLEPIMDFRDQYASAFTPLSLLNLIYLRPDAVRKVENTHISS